MEDDLQWKTTSNGRQPPMEDNLKILKVEYLSNHWLDFPQILNLRKGDQTKTTYFLKWRQPQKKTTSKNQHLYNSATTNRIFFEFWTYS